MKVIVTADPFDGRLTPGTIIAGEGVVFDVEAAIGHYIILSLIFPTHANKAPCSTETFCFHFCNSSNITFVFAINFYLIVLLIKWKMIYFLIV